MLEQPNKHLLVQSQQWNFQNTVCNCLKLTIIDFKHCSGISIADFTQFNTG